MSDIEKRIERLEEILHARDCVCAQRESQILWVPKDWPPERIQAAEAEATFTCPVHGKRLPPRINWADGRDI
jgi:hypothetical protein